MIALIGIGFAKFRSALCFIQNVILNLECKPKLKADLLPLTDHGIILPRKDSRHHQGRRQQTAGLITVHFLQHIPVVLRIFQRIETLAIYHPGRPRHFRKNGYAFNNPLCRLIASGTLMKRLRQQAVTRKNRGRFIKFLMTRRLPTAKIIIIHGRKIIMNQRIRLNHFKTRRKGNTGLFIHAIAVQRIEQQQRTNPFSSTEQ